jgi:hypothetical protein
MRAGPNFSMAGGKMSGLPESVRMLAISASSGD